MKKLLSKLDSVFSVIAFLLLCALVVFVATGGKAFGMEG